LTKGGRIAQSRPFWQKCAMERAMGRKKVTGETRPLVHHFKSAIQTGEGEEGSYAC